MGLVLTRENISKVRFGFEVKIIDRNRYEIMGVGIGMSKKESLVVNRTVIESYNLEFKRPLEKSQIPTCNIMGVNIAAIDMKWFCSYVQENLKKLSGDYICVSNVYPMLAVA